MGRAAGGAATPAAAPRWPRVPSSRQGSSRPSTVTSLPQTHTIPAGGHFSEANLPEASPRGQVSPSAGHTHTHASHVALREP